MKCTLFIFCLCASGCAPALSDGTACNIGADFDLDAHAGAVQSDGSVTVYGGTRFGPPVGSDDAVVFQRAVHAVFVADLEAQPGTSDFNFRSWTVSIPGDRLEAYTVITEDGSKQASLPVRAFLEGNCVFDLAMADEPIVTFPDTEGESGSGSGSN